MLHAPNCRHARLVLPASSLLSVHRAGSQKSVRDFVWLRNRCMGFLRRLRKVLKAPNVPVAYALLGMRTHDTLVRTRMCSPWTAARRPFPHKPTLSSLLPF